MDSHPLIDAGYVGPAAGPHPVDAELVSLYPALVRFAAACLHRSGDPGDLVQEAMSRLLARPSVAPQVDNVEAYLIRVIARLAVAEGRRQQRFSRLPFVDVGSDPSSPAPPADLTADLLRSLPSRQRACLYLRFARDYSVAQTSELLGCSQGTVKSQTARALQKLRADIEPHTRGTTKGTR